MKLSTLRIPCASLPSVCLSLVAIAGLLIPGAPQASAQEFSHAAVKTPEPIKREHVLNPSSIPAGLRKQLSTVAHATAARTNLTPVNTGAGVVFTCDPNVAAATCAYLNSTVAANLNGTFTNANANIYVLYGTTGLGSSTQYSNFITYDQYVAALTANTNKSAIQKSALSALSTYDAGPYGGSNVEVTSALGANLGFTGLDGITTPAAGEATCTPGTTGCYNVIVTVTNDPGTPLYYDNLGGTEPADAYDFYSVVAHETNEALGTSSCVGTNSAGTALADGCGTGVPSAVDLFRYSGPGALVLDATLDATPGQYFSYDGGNTNPGVGVGGTPLYYNTLANGDDYADYVSSDPCQANYAIQDAEGCPGFDSGRSILNDGGSEIKILNALGYDTPAAQSSQTITFAPLPNVTYGVSPITLTATASSGLAVSYAVTGPATLSGSTLKITGAGLVTVTASQAGNSSYPPATPVSRSFTVAKAVLTVTANNATRAVGAANPTFTDMITGFVNGDSSAVVSGSATETTTATSASPAGTYPITFSTKALVAANYTFNYVNGTLTVTGTAAGNFTITVTPPVETIRRGNIAGFILTLKSVNGFNGTVALSCSGGPVGSYCIDFPMKVNVHGTAYAVSGILFPKNTTPGTYVVTLKGVSGSLTTTATAKFTVTN
jgi:hypothetical protein